VEQLLLEQFKLHHWLIRASNSMHQQLQFKKHLDQLISLLTLSKQLAEQSILALLKLQDVEVPTLQVIWSSMKHLEQ
jgi:hypothetical protein